MAQVDMDMKNLEEKENQENHVMQKSTTLLSRRIRSQPQLCDNASQKATLVTAGKLSRLLSGTQTMDKDLATYIEARNQSRMAHQFDQLRSADHLQARGSIENPNGATGIVNRMVPTEQTKLTEVLHEYIQAHKLKNTTSDSTNKLPGTQKNGNSAFSLVTGQPETIKSQYSAVIAHPKERVNEILKLRDELRKRARESDRITADKGQILALTDALSNENSIDAFELGQNFNSELMQTEAHKQKILRQLKTIEKIK